MNLSQGNHKLRLINVYERGNPILKIAKMTVTENWDYGHLSKQLWSVTVILAIFLNRIFSSALPQCILYGKYIYTNAKNK